MPPRTRKAAAPTASPDQGTAPEAVSPEISPPAVDGDATPAGQHDTAPHSAPEPEEHAPDGKADPLSPAAQAVAALIAPPTITYRWTSLSGADSAPCRLCAPAGPPVGAGSFGCGHGQWVLVAAEAD